MNLTWIVPGRLAAMSMPWPEDLVRLGPLGFVGIISLTREPPEAVDDSGLRLLHLPIRDFTPPTPGQLSQAIAFIAEAAKSDGATVVHCGAGLGRTGTVCSAWLVAEGMAADDAIARVRSLRPGSVETRAQEEMVRLFERLHRSSQS